MQASMLWFAGALFALGACRSSADNSGGAQPQKGSGNALASASADPAPGPSPTKQTFGAAVRSADVQALASVLGSPESYQGKTLVVEGQVRRACTRKGCWMELATGAAPESPGCRVTFKDYGFFVPTDSAGSSARVEALVELSSLSATHVAHLEREGAQFPNKLPDGTAREVRLVANAVELWR